MPESKKQTIAEKLLEMQRRVDKVVKDGKNQSDKYDFASDENVLDTFRPIMDELGLLLIPIISGAEVHEGATRSGTTRYMTEMHMIMRWVDAATNDTIDVPWYAQGVDLAGEKGVGKALTYGEKYFLLKFFHVATKKDDPDSDGRTGNGEKKQRGTQAEKENLDYYRAAIPQRLSELYGGDGEMVKAALIAMTKNDSRGFAGVDDVAKLSAAALPAAYGKIKKAYVTRLGKEFELRKGDEPDANA
ncbi:MAG: ERF family protein [Oscillospiraceae bacterium]|nr:ERF family protein [Oscillospiraceae bacterium]